MAKTPRIFHFIFGLRPQTEPFHLAYYLCLESCRQINRPDEIRLHYRHIPYGPWWERIAPHLRLCAVGAPATAFDPGRYQATPEGRFIQAQGLDYAHEADFLRLELLDQQGGVYVDIDSLFVQAYPDALYEHDCVLGEEPPTLGSNGVLRPSLCNAVILAQAGAAFVRRWREAAATVFDGSWSRHSCQEAARLWAASPRDVYVAPRRMFYRFGVARESFAALFEESCANLRGAYSIHLWSHLWWSARRTDFSAFHAGMLTESYVRESTATYAQLARRFLEPTP